MGQLKGTTYFSHYDRCYHTYVYYMFYRNVIVRSGGNALLILDLLISNKLLCGLLLACI